jgi:hypothetical protein
MKRRFKKGDTVFILDSRTNIPRHWVGRVSPLPIDFVVDGGYYILDQNDLPYFLYEDQVRAVTKLDKALQ